MTDGNKKTDPNASAMYDAMNSYYRMLDESMRQGQKVAEQFWGPWMRNFGAASPFVPPEQWIRAYGDMAMVWMRMARSWTEGMTGTVPPTAGATGADEKDREAEGSKS
jgi:hypothetical protein